MDVEQGTLISHKNVWKKKWSRNYLKVSFPLNKFGIQEPCRLPSCCLFPRSILASYKEIDYIYIRLAPSKKEGESKEGEREKRERGEKWCLHIWWVCFIESPPLGWSLYFNSAWSLWRCDPSSSIGYFGLQMRYMLLYGSATQSHRIPIVLGEV